MNYKFVWNTVSFNQASDADIFQKLRDALHGLIEVPGTDVSVALYFDGKTSILERKISPSYVVQDFIDNLLDSDESELVQILLELEDKADAINDLSDDDITVLAESCYYFTVLGYSGSVDCLALVSVLDGILFSVQTSDAWLNHEVKFSTYPPVSEEYRPSIAFSVCNVATGKLVASLLEPVEVDLPLAEILPNCVFTKAFEAWIDELTQENITIVKQKLKLAHARSFDGGKPLFETLTDAEGMREIRMKAHAGGAIRILFGSVHSEKVALLRGFIKKSDNEGYSTNIPAALKDWRPLKVHCH